MRAYLLAMLMLCVGASTARAEPITTSPWQEAVVSVGDLAATQTFFTEIGGFDVLWRGRLEEDEVAFYGLPKEAEGEVVLLGQSGFATGQIRLVKFSNAGRQEPMRPGGHAWDNGCYFSLMVRMKNMDQIYDQAIAAGWWTETPITPLSFGTSKLKVVIFRGPQGLQVQGYERLAPPLPDTIPAFDKMSAPFNMMQMVRDRDAAYAFFTDKLGFDTFYHGKPFRSQKPEPMPIGIPINITDRSAYAASITYPVAGEFGRMEMIETVDLKGYDFRDRCHAPNYGILAVRFPVDDLLAARAHLERADIKVLSEGQISLAPGHGQKAIAVSTPDGARVEFYSRD